MGTNTIAAAVAGAIIKAANHNAIRGALNEDFFPRNSSGVVTTGAGSLGSATYKWLNLYLSKIFVGSNNIEISVDNSELIFKISGTEYARITNSHLFPPGIIVAHSIAANIGTAGRYQWLYCNGQAVSRSDYSRLFGFIGTTYGEGDGSNTFNVPDFRARFLRGFNDDVTRDPDRASRTAMNTGGNTGNTIGSIQGEATKSPSNAFTGTVAPGGSHNHLMSTFARSQANFSGTNTNFPVEAAMNGTDYYTDTENNHTHGLTISGGGDNETRPINAYVPYIIKT